MIENNNLHIPSTVYKWMKQLGFKYEAQHKGYYVNSRDNKPVTIAHQKDFVHHYLIEEMQMFHWIQVTEEETVRLEEMGVITPNTAYQYNQPLTGLL